MIAERPAAGRVATPYVGLSFYTESDAARFFGRDHERAVIMGNLRAARLTLLYGASGVGKSSLLRAGVAARLRELAAHALSAGGASCYVPVVFSAWKDDPVAEMVAEIERVTNSFLDPEAHVRLPRGQLRAAIDAAAEALEAAPGAEHDRPPVSLALILDQFEEYFLYSSGDRRTGDLAADVAECIDSGDARANFLISIREDAYAALGDMLKGHLSDVYGNYLHLEYLDESEAREAIEKPLERYNAARAEGEQVLIEAGVVKTVLRQVEQDSKIITPYLQLVMTALWEREMDRGSQLLRLATLTELQGAERIVAAHLDDALGRLDPRDRELAVDVLHHLVTPSGTKIALEVGDLAAYTDRPPDRIAAVLGALAGQARILREVPRAPGKSQDDILVRRFEIYHDVLADPINAAVAASETRRLERARRVAEERARRERRQARLFKALAAAAGALLVVALAAGFLASREAKHARRAQHVAVSRQLAGQAVADLQRDAIDRGVLLAVEAYRSAHTVDAKSALVAAQASTRGMKAYLTGHTGEVTAVAFSPDGRTVAAAGHDETAIVWDAATSRRQAVLRGHTGGLSSVAFSPDGRLVATASADRTVILWDPRSGRRLRTLPGRAAIESVAFSPDGRALAAAGDDRTVVLWDTGTWRRLRVLRGHVDAVYSLAFSRSGRLLASAGADGRAVVWNWRTGRRLRTLHQPAAIYSVAFSPDGRSLALGGDGKRVVVRDVRTRHTESVLKGPGDAVESVAFSPDGRTLAAGSDDMSTTLWDVRSGRRLDLLGGHSDSVNAVAFSPDGRTLAAGSDDRTVTLWAPRSPSNVRTLAGHRGDVQGVAFSSDGRRLASAGADGVAIVWDTRTGRRLETLRGHRNAVTSVAFDRAGRVLATGGADRRIVLWDVASGRRLHVLRGHGAVVYDVAFSPDGTTLASAAADKTVMLWSAATGRRLRVLRGHSDAVDSVAFSPDGRTLASGGADGSIVLWDPRSGRRKRVLAARTQVAGVAFSRDGRQLFAGGADQVVTVWDVRTGQRVGDPFAGQTDSLTSVAASPDGHLLASASGDGSVVVWNVATRLGQPAVAHVDPALSVAFAPDGRTIASGGADRAVTLAPVPAPVNADAEMLTRRLCGVVRRNLSRAEWRQLVTDQDYRATCPGWPAGS